MSKAPNEFAALNLERMEGRDVPAASVALQGQALMITSNAAADVVVVTQEGNRVQVAVNGQVQESFARSQVDVVVFDGGGGDDVFFNATNRNSVALGGDGNDTLVTVAGDNFLFGGAGNDILVGGSGTDVLLGEAGRDTLFGGPGRDILLGGPGRDVFFGGIDPRDTFNDATPAELNNGGNGGDDDDDGDDD
jgi:Ca2+-binding RTX toxin-like protein